MTTFLNTLPESYKQNLRGRNYFIFQCVMYHLTQYGVHIDYRNIFFPATHYLVVVSGFIFSVLPERTVQGQITADLKFKFTSTMCRKHASVTFHI